MKILKSTKHNLTNNFGNVDRLLLKTPKKNESQFNSPKQNALRAITLNNNYKAIISIWYRMGRNTSHHCICFFRWCFFFAPSGTSYFISHFKVYLFYFPIIYHRLIEDEWFWIRLNEAQKLQTFSKKKTILGTQFNSSNSSFFPRFMWNADGKNLGWYTNWCSE